jgi:hypothetical protein
MSKPGAAGPEFNREHVHCLFDVKGIVHREFVPLNTPVNSDFYCDVLRRLRETVRRKGPELWHNHNWLLHHDKAPAHASLKTTEFVTNNMVTVAIFAIFNTQNIYEKVCSMFTIYNDT